MKHVVMFSGGVGSWGAAKRVVAQHGAKDMVLLFCDTLIEDPDLYRFLDQAASNVGAPLVRIAEGRTPWQVFRDRRFLGNSRVDPCSEILKRKMADKWIAEHFSPSTVTIHVGIDWSEIHRFDRAPGTRGPKDKGGLKQRRAADGWRYEAPLCDAPYLTKDDLFAWLAQEGIKRPRLYDLGLAHNNCGGGCVKAGIGHWALVYRVLPDVFAQWEQREVDLRAQLGDVSMLVDRRGGVRTPLPLFTLRRRLEAGEQCDSFDIGGCGCFAEETIV